MTKRNPFRYFKTSPEITMREFRDDAMAVWQSAVSAA
jgi:hypothetical protein